MFLVFYYVFFKWNASATDIICFLIFLNNGDRTASRLLCSYFDLIFFVKLKEVEKKQKIAKIISHEKTVIAYAIRQEMNKKTYI